MLMPSSGETNDDKANWTYQPEPDAVPIGNSAPKDTSLPPAISWTASEFIEVQKGASWHVLFFIGIAVISGLIYFFAHDFMAPITIILASIIFVIITSKKPRELPYELNNQGLQIGTRFYKYDSFKSFDLGFESGVKSINFMPLKRFMPELSIYFPPEQEKAILNLLSLHLPHEHRADKAVDKFARKLRF
jgi:hypothetical protein